MSKRAMYTTTVDELSTDDCEVLLFLPRSKLADYTPPPVEELERIRREVAEAARQTRGVKNG